MYLSLAICPGWFLVKHDLSGFVKLLSEIFGKFKKVFGGTRTTRTNKQALIHPSTTGFFASSKMSSYDCPSWAVGFSDRDSAIFTRRILYSFRPERSD